MGHSYPEGILTNADLEKMVDTNDEWITTRTGIKQRHKALLMVDEAHSIGVLGKTGRGAGEQEPCAA